MNRTQQLEEVKLSSLIWNPEYFLVMKERLSMSVFV
jgi:hypothetical protein